MIDIETLRLEILPLQNLDFSTLYTISTGFLIRRIALKEF